jgi:hypothetical protein
MRNPPPKPPPPRANPRLSNPEQRGGEGLILVPLIFVMGILLIVMLLQPYLR